MLKWFRRACFAVTALLVSGPAVADDHLLGTIEATIDGEERIYYVVVSPEIGPLGFFNDFVLPNSLQFTVYGLRDADDHSIGDILTLQFIERKSPGGQQVFESQLTGYQPEREPAFPQYRTELEETILDVDVFDRQEDRVHVRLNFESQLSKYTEAQGLDETAPKLKVSGTLDVEFLRP